MMFTHRPEIGEDDMSEHDLTVLIERRMAEYEPDVGNWPTGEMVEVIVAAVREYDAQESDDNG